MLFLLIQNKLCIIQVYIINNLKALWWKGAMFHLIFCQSNIAAQFFFYGKVSHNISVLFSLNYCIFYDTIIMLSVLIKLINDSLRANLKKMLNEFMRWFSNFFLKKGGPLGDIRHHMTSPTRQRGTACSNHIRYPDTHCGYSSPANEHHVEQSNCPVESSQPTVAVPTTCQTLFSVPGIKYWGKPPKVLTSWNT